MYESAAVNRAYDYDRYGNRYVGTSSSQIPSPIAPGPTMPGHFNTANNRLVMSGTGFDAAGNQTTLAPYTLEYDAEGRNTVVKLSGASSATFSYDGEGRRVRKAMNGGTTYYLYDALGQMAVEYSTEPPSSTGSSYLFADMLGSVRTITNDVGAVVECYDYLPFGRMLGSGVGGRGSCYPDPPDANYDSRAPQKFTGKERDAETGLDYFLARYYSASQGRFTSTDPVIITPERLRDPQPLNAYAYVRNNPLKFIDPTGEILTISGDIEQIKQELCKQIGGDCSRVDYDKESRTITVDLTNINLDENEGAAVLDDVVASTRHYDLYVGNQIPTLAGPRPLEFLENLDVNPDARYRKGKTDKFLPPSGIDDQIGINPTAKRETRTDLLPATMDSLIFHELAESYAKIDGGMQYKDAHQKAIQREKRYRDQNPYLKNHNPGSGPGDAVIRQR
jgi:RHS repeat-associated protein